MPMRLIGRARVSAARSNPAKQNGLRKNPNTALPSVSLYFLQNALKIQHLESYRRFVPEAEVVAVYTRDRPKAEAFAHQHHIARWFTDLEQTITESDCAVVDICLPNFLHHRAVMTAAKAGKHVIFEKPLS